VEQETLISYIAFLARKLQASSIPNYLNVIRLLHLEAGFKNPLADNFEVNLIKKGVNRQLGLPPKQKEPMTLSILRKIHVLLDVSKPSDLAFWAACVVGFFGFLRKSTLLPASRDFVEGKILTRADVTNMCIDSFVLIVRQSKVIQFGEKIHSIPFVRGSEFILCPVRSVMSHFGASPLGAKRPLFNFLVAGREVALTQESFVSRLKGLLKGVGLNSGEYSAHSLRRGGASYAFQLGLSPLQIKLRGDWSSDSYEQYIFIAVGHPCLWRVLFPTESVVIW
jgi:hypothetical protein